MFGHHHRDEEIGERVENLARHLAPDFLYVSPEASSGGTRSRRCVRPLRNGGGPTNVRRTSPVDIHHSYFRDCWERVERGTVAAEGWRFGWLDEGGAICQVVTFEGLVPEQPDGRS